MEKKDYIKWIRSKVGHERIILSFAGGCVFNDKGEVLLGRRADYNKWGFPGGAMELGETAEETAIREYMEETGLEVRVKRLIGVYSGYLADHPNGDKAQSVVIAFEMEIVGGELKINDDESLELKFFPIDETPELFCKQHEDFLEDIKNKRYGVYR